MSNLNKAIIKLISGVALLVLLTGIFTELYDFWYGVIGAIGVGIISASFKSLFGIQFRGQMTNLNKAIIKLISGVALLVLLTGIFTELYDFWYGVIGAFAVAIIANTLNTLLQSNTLLKSNFVKSIITLLSGVALLVLLTGIFTELYDFWYGLIGAIGVGIISASFKSLFGIQDAMKDKDED